MGDKMNRAGGPAFPVLNAVYSDGKEAVGQSAGMTLRDYFAAHAPVPDEFPDWFQFDESGAGEPPVQPAFPSGLTPMDVKNIKWAAGEGQVYEDLPPEMRSHWPEVEKWKAFYVARDARNKRRAALKYAAWRWAYADLMLETRPQK